MNNPQTYFIHEKNNQQCITCLVCRMTSYNPNDIKHKWCGYCNEPHPISQQITTEI